MSEKKIFPKDIPVIKELYKTHTLQEIGDQYGISRERIRQILKNNGMGKQIRYYEFECGLCHRKDAKRIKRVRNPYYCNSCDRYKERHEKNPSQTYYARSFEITACKRCGKRRGNRKGFCSSCYAWNFFKTHPSSYERHLKWNREYMKRKKLDL